MVTRYISAYTQKHQTAWQYLGMVQKDWAAVSSVHLLINSGPRVHRQAVIALTSLHPSSSVTLLCKLSPAPQKFRCSSDRAQLCGLGSGGWAWRGTAARSHPEASAAGSRPQPLPQLRYSSQGASQSGCSAKEGQPGAGGGHGGQQGTPARHSIKGCSPTVPEEEEQSRAGDSEQGWPWLVTAGHRERWGNPRASEGVKPPMQGTRPGTSVPTTKPMASLPSCRLSLFYLSKQLVITVIAVARLIRRLPCLPRDPVRKYFSYPWVVR